MSVPQAFLCPITLEVMEEPVIVAVSGRSYSKQALLEYIAECKKKRSKIIDPITRQRFNPKNDVHPNRALVDAIEEWRKGNSYANNTIPYSDSAVPENVIQYIHYDIQQYINNKDFTTLNRMLRSDNISDVIIKQILIFIAKYSNHDKKDTKNKQRTELAVFIPALIENISKNIKFPTITAVTVQRLARNIHNRVIIARSGGISVLISLLQHGNRIGKSNAVLALTKICLKNENNQRAVVEAGAIPLLVSLLQHHHVHVKVTTTALLRVLTSKDKNKLNTHIIMCVQIIVEAGGIPLLISLLQHDYEKGKTYAAGVLRNIASNYNNKILIAEAGGIPALVSLLQGNNENGKIIAAGALCNLSMNDNNKILIAEAGGIPALLSLLRHGNEGKTNAACALRNLSINDNNRILIAEAGGIPVFESLLEHGNDKAKHYATIVLNRLKSNNIML